MSRDFGTGRVDRVAGQTAAFTTAAASISNAFGSQTYKVRVSATQACFYKVGTTPTATTTDVYLPANWVEYITVTPGQKISAIRSTADGTLSVVEVD